MDNSDSNIVRLRSVTKPKEEDKSRKGWSWAKSPLLHPVVQMLLNLLPRSISNLVTGEDPAFSSLTNTTRSKRDDDSKLHTKLRDGKMNIFNAYKHSKLISGHKLKVHPAIPPRELPIKPRKRRDTADDLEAAAITVYSSIHRTDPLREQEMYPIQEGLLNIERPRHSEQRKHRERGQEQSQSNERKFQHNSKPNRNELQHGSYENIDKGTKRYSQTDDRRENESNKHLHELDPNHRGEEGKEGEEERVMSTEYSRKNYDSEDIQPHSTEDEHSKPKHHFGYDRSQDDRRKHGEDADEETRSQNDPRKHGEDADEETRSQNDRRKHGEDADEETRSQNDWRKHGEHADEETRSQHDRRKHGEDADEETRSQNDRRKHGEDADEETRSQNDRRKHLEGADDQMRWHTPSDNKRAKENGEPEEEETPLRIYDESEYRPQTKVSPEETKYSPYEPEIHKGDEASEGMARINHSRNHQPESDNSDSRERMNHPSNKEYDEGMQRVRHSEQPEENEKYESDTEIRPQNSETVRSMQDEHDVRDQLYNIEKPEKTQEHGTSHYRSDANGGIQRKDYVRNSFPREEQRGQYNNRHPNSGHQDNIEHMEEHVGANKHRGESARRRPEADSTYDSREFSERDEVLPNPHRQSQGSDNDRDSSHSERVNEQYNRNSQRKENLHNTEEEEQRGDKLKKEDTRKSLDSSEEVQKYYNTEDQYHFKDSRRGNGQLRERENVPIRTGEQTQHSHSLDSRGEKNSAEDHKNAWHHDHTAKTYDETETHSRGRGKHVANPANTAETKRYSSQRGRGREEEADDNLREYHQEEAHTSTKQQHKYSRGMRRHRVENPRASETEEGESTYTERSIPRSERKKYSQVGENERYPSDDHRKNVQHSRGHRRHEVSHSSHKTQDPKMRRNNKPRSLKYTEKEAYKVQEMPLKLDDESEEYDNHNTGASNHKSGYNGRILRGHSKAEEDPVTVHDHRGHKHMSRNSQEELHGEDHRYEERKHPTQKHPSMNAPEEVRGRGDRDEETDHPQRKYPSRHVHEELRDGIERYEEADHPPRKHSSRKEVALSEELAGSAEVGDKYYQNNDEGHSEETFNGNTDSKGINHAKDSLHSPKGVISNYQHEDDEEEHANKKEKIPIETENLREIHHTDEDVGHEKLSDVDNRGLTAPETISDKIKTIPMSEDQLIQYIAERIPYPTTPRRDVALRGEELEREMKDFTESKIREIQSTKLHSPIVTDQQEPKRQSSAYYEVPETLTKEYKTGDSAEVEEELPLINQKQRMRPSAEDNHRGRRIRFPESESKRQYYEKSHQEDTHHLTGKQSTEEHKQRDLPGQYISDRSGRLPIGQHLSDDDRYSVKQHEDSRVQLVQEDSREEVVPTLSSHYIPNIPTDVSYESAQNRISLLQNGEQLDNIMMEDRLKNASAVRLSQRLKNSSSDNVSQDSDNRDTALESKQHQLENNRDRLELSSPEGKYNDNSRDGRENESQRIVPTPRPNTTQSESDERLVGPGDGNQSNISQKNSRPAAKQNARIVHFILPDYNHSQYTDGRWKDESELRKPIVDTIVTTEERARTVEKEGNERPRRRTVLREEERDDLRKKIHADDLEGEKKGSVRRSTEDHHVAERSEERIVKKAPHSQESTSPLPRRSPYITEDEVREALGSLNSRQTEGERHTDKSGERDASHHHTAYDEGSHHQNNEEEAGDLSRKQAAVEEDVDDLPQSSARKEERRAQSEDVLKTIAKILEKKYAISRDDISGYEPREYRNSWSLEYSGPKKT